MGVGLVCTQYLGDVTACAMALLGILLHRVRRVLFSQTKDVPKCRAKSSSSQCTDSQGQERPPGAVLGGMHLFRRHLYARILLVQRWKKLQD